MREILGKAGLPCKDCIHAEGLKLIGGTIRCQIKKIDLIVFTKRAGAVATTYTDCHEPEAEIKGSQKKEYIEFEKKLVEYWNTFVKDIPGLSSIVKISVERRRHLKARYSDKHFRENIFKAIDMIRKSKFLRGESGKKWKADFDFLTMNGTNYIKILEGKYRDYEDDRPKTGIRKYMRE